MVGLARKALRESGRVLAHPKRIRRVRTTLGSPCMHGFIRGQIVDQAQVVNLHAALENDFDQGVRRQGNVEAIKLFTAGGRHSDGDAQIFTA